MARIPNHLLQHRVNIRPRRTLPGSTGDKYLPTVSAVPAIVVDKVQTVTDQREATKGQAVVSATHVLVQPEQFVQPGSLVTVWPGTPMAREAEVVAVAYARHTIAPESAQFWLT